MASAALKKTARPQATNTPLTAVSSHLGSALKKYAQDVVYRPLAELRPCSNNARLHSEHQIEKLSQLIARFGFLIPILVDDERQLVTGHARLEAAKRAGLTELPTICVKHLTASELKAFRISENKIGELAEWDTELLGQQLVQLQAELPELDLELLGFETGELDLLMDPAQQHREDPDDQLPDLTGIPVVTRPGDIWSLGPHLISCANALHQRSLAQLMAGQQAAMAFTDPPYNVKVQGHITSSQRHAEFAMASGEMSDTQFTEFLATAHRMIARYCQEGALLYSMMDWRHCKAIIDAAQLAKLDFVNLAVWAKQNGGMGSFYRSAHELCFIFRNGHTQHKNNIRLGRYGRNRTNLWSYPACNSFGRERDEALASHPTVKPVALVADAIKDCTRRGDIVLDPFLGAGTTLLAAERTGRVARGMDIEPRYVDVSIRRWEKRTGLKAIHRQSGLPFEQVASTRQQEGGTP